MIAFALIGCGSNSTSPTPSDPGSPLSLQRLGAQMKPTSEIKVLPSMAEQVYDFDLDTVATSASYLFIPNNSSTSAITGMKLKFDNPKFVVSPDTITTLSAPDKNTGITPLIKVTVVHGKEALGIGYDDMLTADQYGTLTISGENADGKFSVEYTMHVYAKRMVITIKEDTAIGGTRGKLIYAEIDDESNGCYVESGGHVLSSTTRIIRRSDYPDSLSQEEFDYAVRDTRIGLWYYIDQFSFLLSLADSKYASNYGTGEVTTNCPTYVIRKSITDNPDIAGIIAY